METPWLIAVADISHLSHGQFVNDGGTMVFYGSLKC